MEHTPDGHGLSRNELLKFTSKQIAIYIDNCVQIQNIGTDEIRDLKRIRR